MFEYKLKGHMKKTNEKIYAIKFTHEFETAMQANSLNG